MTEIPAQPALIKKSRPKGVEGVIARLEGGWSRVCDFFEGLWVARVAAASAALGFLLYFGSSQAQDLFLEVKGSIWADIELWTGFYLALILGWALPVFISSRWVLKRRRHGIGALRDIEPWVSKWVPLVLAGTCFAAVFVGQITALQNAPAVTDPAHLAAFGRALDMAQCSQEAILQRMVCTLEARASKISEHAFGPYVPIIFLYQQAGFAVVWFWIAHSLKNKSFLANSKAFRRILLSIIGYLLSVAAVNVWGPIVAGTPASNQLDLLQFVPELSFVILLIAVILTWCGIEQLLRWFTTVNAIVLLAGVCFIAYGYVGLEKQAAFGLTHLLFLPAVTVLICILLTRVHATHRGDQAPRLGQIPGLIAGRGGPVEETVGTMKVTTRLFVPLLALTMAITIALFVVHPLNVTDRLGLHRASLLPILLGLTVAVLTYISEWSARLRAPLILATVILFAALGSLWGTEHRIRTAASAGPRMDLAAAIKGWKKANDCAGPGQHCPAPIIVAAAGGASRSAVHVAGIIGALLDEGRFVPVRHWGEVADASFSPSGRRFVTASEEGIAVVSDTETWRPVVLEGHKSGVVRARFSSDGHRVVTASRDGTARVWNAETGEQTAVMNAHRAGVVSASFSPDGRRIVTNGYFDKVARVWNAASGDGRAVLNGHTGYVMSARFSPDGRRIVTAAQDGTARIWNAEGGAQITILKGHQPERWLTTASFSPDGHLIVTASLDKTTRVWEAESGKEIAALKGHTDSVYDASFSPNGRRIVTASGDGTARVWDAESGKEIALLKGHMRQLVSARFSPNGRRIITASWDNTARVWDAESGAQLAVLHGHEFWLSTASFSPDGRLIVTASRDKTARLWDADTYHRHRWKVPEQPSFGTQLFAFSSVSGGSLGAAITYAALADARRSVQQRGIGRPPCDAKASHNDKDWFLSHVGAPFRYSDPSESWRECLQLLAAGDFLSPVFVTLLSTDLFRLEGWRGDRASVLENAWEVRYSRLTGKEDGLGMFSVKDHTSTFAEPLSAIRKRATEAGVWLPILLLNGTSVETGKRIVTSDIDMNVKKRYPFEDAFDLQDLLRHPGLPQGPGEDQAPADPATAQPLSKQEPPSEQKCVECDIRLSTAATMSARFPLVSPPGGIPGSYGAIIDQVVDGGFFENFGATTAAELAAALERIDGSLPKPVIILVNNEPGSASPKCISDTFEYPHPSGSRWFPSISAPLDALFRTREARGTYAAADLCNLSNGRLAFMTVFPDPENAQKELSMSWWLSKTVQKYLDEQIDADINFQAFETINNYRYGVVPPTKTKDVTPPPKPKR